MIWSHQMIEDNFYLLVPNQDERDYTLINPASFDVRIGYTYKTQLGKDEETWSETQYLNEGECLPLCPGELILISLLERVIVPHDCAALALLKSSRAREGFNHNFAGWIDPGWNGYLTLELSNSLLAHNLMITPGLRIAQLIVMQLGEVTHLSYQGRYQHASEVEASKPRDYDLKVKHGG